MKIINKDINSLDSIPARNYVGYYWLSGSEAPKTVKGAFEPKLDSQNLFIQEAMLWDENEKLSIMIQHTHRLIVTAYDLKSCDLSDKTIISYMGHRIKNQPRLKFYRHWEEEPDCICNDMPVLKMKAQVFCGFQDKKTDLLTEKI